MTENSSASKWRPRLNLFVVVVVVIFVYAGVRLLQDVRTAKQPPAPNAATLKADAFNLANADRLANGTPTMTLYVSLSVEEMAGTLNAPPTASKTPGPTWTPKDTSTPLPTRTPGPTWTPKDTSTPLPTRTPGPTWTRSADGIATALQDAYNATLQAQNRITITPIPPTDAVLTATAAASGTFAADLHATDWWRGHYPVITPTPKPKK